MAACHLRSATCAGRIQSGASRRRADHIAQAHEGARQGNGLGADTAIGVSDVREVSAIIEMMAAASEELSAGIGQVNNAVTTLDEVTQQNAALVEEASAASQQTLDLSRVLANEVAYFTLLGEAAASSGPVARAREAMAVSSPPLVLAAAGDVWAES